MYAIIETGGKQYKVTPGDKLRIEKLTAEEGATITFDQVLAVAADGGALTVGKPLLANARVTGKVLAQGKYPKILVFKYHNKTNYRRRYGHRQPFTQVEIVAIEA